MTDNKPSREPRPAKGHEAAPISRASLVAGWISVGCASSGWATLLTALAIYNPPFLGRTVVDGKLLPDTSHFMVRPLIFVCSAMVAAIVAGLIGRRSTAGLLGLSAGVLFVCLALSMFLSAY